MTADNAVTGDELAFSSLTDAAALLRAGKVSPVELVRVCLGRIEAHNPVLNAFITVTAESALREAYDAEAEMRRGEWRGPLHGIPVAIKDMIDIAGVRTTGASAVHLDRIPAADAAVVSRLRRAGAILLGKLNMQEFAIGGSSVPSHFGAVRNPWDTSRIAGGIPTNQQRESVDLTFTLAGCMLKVSDDPGHRFGAGGLTLAKQACTTS